MCIRVQKEIHRCCMAMRFLGVFMLLILTAVGVSAKDSYKMQHKAIASAEMDIPGNWEEDVHSSTDVVFTDKETRTTIHYFVQKKSKTGSFDNLKSETNSLQKQQDKEGGNAYEIIIDNVAWSHASTLFTDIYTTDIPYLDGAEMCCEIQYQTSPQEKTRVYYQQCLPKIKLY